MEDRLRLQLFICFCYIPPKDSTVLCNTKLDRSAVESDVITFSSKGKLVICGDARTSTQSDYITLDDAY